MNKKLSKGFTLIELLVVVAIISLLSSIVLASIRDARDKAKAKAFRGEMQQLINALEIYRANNNTYPSGSFSKLLNGTNSGTLHTVLSSYIKDVPKIQDSSGGIPTSAVYSYYFNDFASSTASLYRCNGDDINKRPPYVITVGSSFPIASSAVKDWRTPLYIKPPTLSEVTGTGNFCYSLR